MVVEAIDVMQTEQIETLQVDIQELEDKLNLAVIDVNELTVKLNSVIVDLRNLYESLMGSDSNDEYVPSDPSSTSTDGLLKKLDNLYTLFWDHIHMPPFSSENQTYRSTHPSFIPNTLPGGPTYTTDIPDSLATISQTSVVPYDENSTPSFPDGGRDEAAVTGLYTPAVQDKVAIILKTHGERRARLLARKIQGQITEEDRIHKN